MRNGPGLRIVINGAWRASTPSSPSAPLAMMNSTSPSKRLRSTLTTRSGYFTRIHLPTRWGGGPDSRREAGPEGTYRISSRRGLTLLHLFTLRPGLVDGAHHVEGLLREVVMLPLEDLLEPAHGLAARPRRAP